jgi:hypothetical protein
MLKQDWFAVPAGEIYPQMFTAGTVLTGDLLERAKALGIVDDQPQGKAMTGAPENKRTGRRK